MSYTAIQNNPIAINLLQQCNDTGWVLNSDGSASHSCNNGSITLNAYPVIAGHTYKVSWVAISIASGYVQVQSPGSNGATQSAAGLFVEQITPTNNGFTSFYSTGTCQIASFNIQDITNQSYTTIVYYANQKKWSDFRTFAPDIGFSLLSNTYTLNLGALYVHTNGNISRNNFYGVQNTSSIKFAGSSHPEVIKKFKSISIQVNELMITTVGGVTTSLGHVSELIDTDFIKALLSGTQYVYTKEGVYCAKLKPDNDTGDPLKGNWITIELLTLDGSIPLQLYTIGLNDSLSRIGTR